MHFSARWPAVSLAAGLVLGAFRQADGADVLGYSVLKGHFLLQTGPSTVVTDPDFGYSILASVDLADFDLLTNATLRTPGNALQQMDNLADFWAFFDMRNSLSALNSAYGWGNYTLSFDAVNDGSYSCVLSLPNTPLPPTPRMTNFRAAQAVNPALPFTVSWTYPSAPRASDFVQVYVTDGHADVFSTPNFGESGALNGTARTVTIPAGTLDPGSILSLNLEITRVVSTNSTAYPWAEGAAGVFRSTAIELTTIIPPRMKILGPTNGVLTIEVRGSAERTNVLQATEDLVLWRNVATNVAPLGKSVFSIPTSASPARWFRARQ
jgi:hypothetical protein